MKIDILGSCVTRDALRFDNPFTLGRYYARTSLVSLYSDSIKIDLDEIDLPSVFNRRMVHYDLTKDFRNYIKWSNADVLVVDFIDERFNILKLGNSYFAQSNEFIKSNINEKLKASKVNRKIKIKLFEKLALDFITEIKEKYEVVVLHKAYWENKYYDSNGEICDFQNQPIVERNSELDHFYNIIEEKFDGIETIKLDNYLASENHQWGLAPYHYEDMYYIEFNKRLGEIVNFK